MPEKKREERERERYRARGKQPLLGGKLVLQLN